MSFPAAIDTGDGSPVIRYCIIRGGYGTYRSNGILLGNTATLSSPRITSTQILGGSAPGSTAIRLRGNCAAVITGCFIFGGTGTTTNTGIFMGNSPSASFIYNNVIACGYTSSAANSYGIESQYANNFISNNTILAGSFSGDAAGICTSYTSKPYINNNIFYLTAGASRYGIYEEGYTTNDPTEVMNNLFFNATVDYHNYSSTLDWADVTAMENGLMAEGSTSVSGNIDADPLFAATDNLHLNTGSPAIGTGLNGIDEGWPKFPLDETSVYPVDMELRARPGASSGAWDIGAYQH
jgi:hypothetical protein